MKNAMSTNLNTYGLIGQDAACTYSVLKNFIDNLDDFKKQPLEYGVTQGYDSFIALNLIQDISVFVHEMIGVFPELKTSLLKEIDDKHFFENLEKIRNAIHIIICIAIVNRSVSYKNFDWL